MTYHKIQKYIYHILFTGKIQIQMSRTLRSFTRKMRESGLAYFFCPPNLFFQSCWHRGGAPAPPCTAGGAQSHFLLSKKNK
jgi:hypothetical protein